MTLGRWLGPLVWPHDVACKAPAVGARRKELGQSMLALLATDHNEEGQGLAEYALILSLIAVIAIAALVFLGTQISNLISTIGAAI
jgi:pilus assembly protein Flp/PilA